jgi:hypothetical protein
MIKTLAILFVGSLIAAVFAGISLLKFYEEFRKGVEEKSRLRIWSAFFGLSFVLLFFFFVMRKL